MDKLDYLIRYRGGTRKTFACDQDTGIPTLYNSPVISHGDMEDALIAALDAGLSVEEIADIQLGSMS